MTRQFSAIRTLLLIGLLQLWPSVTRAQDAPEVRQLVTFLFAPGRSGDALRIYEEQLRPAYDQLPALRRFRGYREIESPEPLDLVVISSYRGMAGMDTANAALRRQAPGALALYGTLAAMSQWHHDQFVEIESAWSDSARDDTPLTVFEYLRLAPGARRAFERLLVDSVRPFERAEALTVWSEGGRMLVSDGWHVLRIHGVRSLGDWHERERRLREAPFADALDGQVAARKTIILRVDPRLSVR